MTWRTPEFWSTNGLAAKVLQPFATFYGWLMRQRWKRSSPETVDIPVLCVGNLTVGGAGKTPTALLLGRLLQAEGKRIHFLTRGYGGKLGTPPIQVNTERHTAGDVGDEALLLAACAPCWVATDRFAGAQSAWAAGAELVVMDDGFQNPGLHKDLSILVVDGAYGFGNGRLFPAGPLRERIADGFSRADALLLVGEDQQQISEAMPPALLLLNATLAPAGNTQWLQGTRVVAFAGIGRPEKFFSLLEALGAEIIERFPFPDHHRFRTRDLERLTAASERQDALLVTTEKDAVRLPQPFRHQVKTVPVEMQLEDPAALRALLKTAGV